MHPASGLRIKVYISTQEEPGEALEATVVFGCDEYMPDYEGKATPYHQNVQIVSKFIEETDLVPGKDVFITPRAPSAVQENRFRQLMVMMSIAEANCNAFGHSDIQAINEFVHPMTGTLREIIDAQQHMVDVSELTPTINRIADLLHQQRDRLMYKGSGAYSRNAPDISSLVELCRIDIGKDLEASMPAENLHLPRAIKFTGALYSITDDYIPLLSVIIEFLLFRFKGPRHLVFTFFTQN